MQASDLVYRGVMDANRRHDIPGSETKENLLQAQMAVDSLSALFPLILQAPIPTVKEVQKMPVITMSCFIGQEQ